MNWRLLFIFSTILSTPNRAFAPDAWFGPEFTFTKGIWKLVEDGSEPSSPRTLKKLATMREKMEGRCRSLGCKIEERRTQWDTPSFRVHYPDGWWIEYSTDPGEIEIKMKPASLATIESHREVIDRDIFALTREVGLHVSNVGHLNIGIGVFRDDARLFRNFIVECVNNSYLFDGIFRHPGPTNQKLIAELPLAKQKAFAQAIARFDAGEITGITELAREIWTNVYDGKPGDPEAGKYHAINLSSLVDPSIPPDLRRIELRRIRAQKDLDEFLLESKFFQARIDSLRTLDKSLAIETQPQQVTSRAEKIVRFRELVEASNLSWKEYEKIPDNTAMIYWNLRDVWAECRTRFLKLIHPAR